MNVFALYLYTVVAIAQGGAVARDWRPMGEYAGVEACQKAAALLPPKGDSRTICVDTGFTVEVKKGGR